MSWSPTAALPGSGEGEQAGDDRAGECKAQRDKREKHAGAAGRRACARAARERCRTGPRRGCVESTGMKAEEKAPSAKSFRRLLGMLKTALMASAAPDAAEVVVEKRLPHVSEKPGAGGADHHDHRADGAAAALRCAFFHALRHPLLHHRERHLRQRPALEDAGELHRPRHRCPGRTISPRASNAPGVTHAIAPPCRL